MTQGPSDPKGQPEATAAPPRRLIPLFAGPRSGSNFLTDVLGKMPGIIALSEVFNPSEVYGLNLHPELDKRVTAAAGSREKLTQLFRMEPVEATALLVEHAPPDAVLVIKIQPNQVHARAVRTILERYAGGCVFLVRRRLDQYVSLLKASQTQAWLKSDTTELKPDVSLSPFLSWSAVLDEWFAEMNALAAETGLDRVDFEYEVDLKTGIPQDLARRIGEGFPALSLALGASDTPKKSYFTRQDLTEDPFAKVAKGADLRATMAELGCLDYALSAQRTVLGSPPDGATSNGDIPYASPDLRTDPGAALALMADGRFDDLRGHLSRTGHNAPPKAVTSGGSFGFTRFTFICGLQHSGAAAVQDGLAAAYDVATVREVEDGQGGALGDPDLFALTEGLDPAPETDALSAAVLAERLCRTWAEVADDPLNRHLVHTAPTHLTRIAYLRSLFPEARFLVVVRDPRVVALEVQARRPALSLDLLMAHWHAAHLTALGQMGPDCQLIRYEDFCADPQDVVQRAGDFCGLPLRPVFETAAPRPDGNEERLADWPKDWTFEPELKAWRLFGYNF